MAIAAHAVVLLLALTVGSDESNPNPAATPAPPKAAPCSTREHRQFDFWLGEWNVAGKNGQPAGTNRITRVLGGCALRAEWMSRGGHPGTSLNVYDAATRRWRQTWVDDRGGVLLLEGGLRDGSMVLEGERPADSGGGRVTNRIVWTPLSGGRVRQHWQSSTDGKTWNEEFDGIYSKAKNLASRSAPPASGSR